jgi:membrane-anchored protein YejM (alkaline phosphatase superfamily)
MTPRRRLCRWAGWFALVNAALLALIGLRYLWYYSRLAPATGWIYALIAFLGHMGALAALLLLLLLPLILLIPRPQVIVPLASVLGGAGASLLLLDTSVFAENRYHLDVLTLAMFEPRSWAALALYFLLGLGIEAMLARWAWRRTALPAKRRVGAYLALALAGCFLASHVIHAWAEAHAYAPVTAFTRYLPLYFPLKDSRRMDRLGLVNETRAREHRRVAAMGRPSDGGLRYPLAPLRCDPPSPRLNVLLVVIDGMRADALSPAVAPTLSAFAQGAVRFDAHYSGGMASRAGMFSIFYSLPATYWDAFADVAQPPVLMDLFRKYDYQLGLFASSPINRTIIGLDRTALARIPNLRLETSSPRPGSSGRDRTLTGEWYDWLGKRDPARPFFGFLYYNAAVAIEPPDDYPSVVPVPPGAPAQVVKRARYLTAVHFVDALFRGVLEDLERRKLLESTVIVVTSDHGVEFDENGLGFTGHGTAYSELQLHTPLLIRWPGRPPGRVSHRTSHFDLAPTLLTGVFGCTNPPSDYASGQDLFTGRPWDWLIAASYTHFALVEPDQVTIVSPTSYEIRDRNYRLIPNPTLPRDHLRAAMHEMRRFYR